MASGKLYKRGEKWYLDIHTGRKVDGKYERIQRKAAGRTKAEAQAELDELLANYRRSVREGIAIDNVYPTQSVCNVWCDHVKRTGHDKKLINGYCILAQRMVDYIGVETVSELDRNVAEASIKKIADDFSTNTANKCLMKFKAALEYAKECGHVISNPIARVKQLRTIRKKFRRELEHEEIEMLLKTAPEPWRIFWRFFLNTGVRSKEFLFLRWSDLDFKRKQIRILERDDFKPKTDAGERVIPMRKEMLADLEHLPKDCEYIFTNNGKQLRPETILDVFREHISHSLQVIAVSRREARKPLPRGVTFSPEDDKFKIDTSEIDIHSLRYTFITELIGGGVDPKTVQYLAGHKSIETTLAIYAKVKTVNTIDAINQIPW